MIESGQFIMGSEVEEFERAVAEYLGVTHAMGVASGTDALYLSLCAAGIGPGDKVIVPAFTFFATAGSVSNVGAVPLFCDIEPETFNLDVSHVRRILESGAELRAQVKAIIPVHLYGQPADMAEVMALAEEFGLVGAVTVVALFLVLLWRGVRASLRAPDRFGFYLGFGLTCFLVVQALINMSIVVNLLPTTGIPLPMISYGGSSMLASCIAIGILLNISQHAHT